MQFPFARFAHVSPGKDHGPASHGTSQPFAGRVVSVAMSLILALTLTPTLSFAQDADGEGADAPAQPAAETQVTADAAASSASDADDAGAGDVLESDTPEADAPEGGSPAADISVGSATEPAADQPAAAVSANELATPEALANDLEDDAATISVTCAVYGPDGSGNTTAWSYPANFDVKDGSTAADLTTAALAKANLAADAGEGQYGYYLNTITSPFDGKVYGWDSATGKYWQLFVNGTAASTGASGVQLHSGDAVVWAYSAYGDPAPSDTVNVTCAVYGPDASGSTVHWAADAAFDLKDGSNAADLTTAALAKAGLTSSSSYGAFGFFLNTITSPFDGKAYGWNSSTGKYWQLFVNGTAASTGASGVRLHNGDSIVWVYSAFGDSVPETVTVTCAVYGPDATGATVPWAGSASFELKEGSTAADLTTAALAKANLAADAGVGQYGYFLNTITSPFDGKVYGWDAGTGKYWQLFVNGTAASTGASGVTLKDGDSIVWAYSAYGDSAPVVKPEIDTGTLPDSYTATWPAFGLGAKNGSALDGVKTPTEAAAESWAFDPFADSGSAGGYNMRGLSDPLIVNGDVYLVGGSNLYKIDAATGKSKLSAPTGFPANYFFSRPAYADGMIFVAANDGSVAAFNADTLKCVWCTDPLPVSAGDSYQNLASIVVANGRVFAEFTIVGAGNVGKAGTMVCVDEDSGNVLWTTCETAKAGEMAGYYWSGAAVSGTDLMIADETGNIKLVDGSTGVVKTQLSLGSASHSGVIALSDVDGNGNGTYLAVTQLDGTLHKIARDSSTLTDLGSVAFAARSASTPAVANGKAFVGGVDAHNYGTLSVIDLATMKVDVSVRAGEGAVQSSPLVSVQGSDVYVYFTCNNATGGVYSYKLGAAAADLIFTPEQADQNYCTASVIADADGNLYYANDSRKLFKLVASAKSDDNNKGGEDADNGSDNGSGNGSGNGSDSGKGAGSVPLMVVNGNGGSATGSSDTEGEDSSTGANGKAGGKDGDSAATTSSTGDVGSVAGTDYYAYATENNGIPIWPFIGMGVAALVLIGALIGFFRRSNGKEA